jgi:hypothetical protein
MMAERNRLASLPAVLALCAAGAAAAAPPVPGDAGGVGAPLVALVGTTEDDPLMGRLAAELRALGFALDTRALAVEDPGVDLEVDAALRAGARAAVRVESRAGRITVSVADPLSHAVTLREVLEGAPTAAVESMLAVRTVEFVRATLLGVPADAPGAGAPSGAVVTKPEPGLPALSAPVAAPVLPALAFSITSGVAAAAGGLGAQGELGLSARLRVGRLVGLELTGLAPITSEAVPGSAAPDARATFWLVGGGLYLWHPVGAAGGLELGAGALAVALRVAGDPTAGWTGGSTTRVGAAGYARAGATFALSRLLALRTDLLVGGAFLRPVASAGGPGAYPWGYGFGAVLAGLEARWF